MTDPEVITDRLDVGLDYFTDLISSEIKAAQFGCASCGCSVTKELYVILVQLGYRVGLELFDETTEELYRNMEMLIPGSIEVVPEPVVNAGADQTINLPEDEIELTATVDVYTSLLWTQVSGPNTAIILNSTQLTAQFTGLALGTYVFKITANNVSRSAFDTVTVTVAQAMVTLEFGYFDTNPYADIIAENPVTFQFSAQINEGATYFESNFTSAGTGKWLVNRRPAAEPAMLKWKNTSFDYGDIPDAVYRPSFVVGDYRYEMSWNRVDLDIANQIVKYSTQPIP